MTRSASRARPPRPAASILRTAAWLATCALSLALGVGGALIYRGYEALGAMQSGAKAHVVKQASHELGREPAAAIPGLAGSRVILAIGTDRRAGDEDRGRSDTMMLVRVDPNRKTVSMLSLPRDLLVPVPGYGERKLNDAYALGGTRLLIATIREYLGVKIDHFAQVDFSGFTDVVANLGGVYLPIDGRYLHRNDGTAANNYADIDIKPGYQRLRSERALSWVRFRHLDSDFTRAARQQTFIRELGRQLQARAKRPAALPGLVRLLADATTSDISSAKETLRLASTLHSTPPDRMNRVTLTGEAVTLAGGSYVSVSDAAKRRALQAWSTPTSRVLRQQKKASQQAPHPNSTTEPRRPSARRSAVAQLVPDGGRGRQLARGVAGRVETCGPNGLPAGYAWGSDYPARAYDIDGRPAAAMWATAGSGNSMLIMFTTWQAPPILRSPSASVNSGGRKVDLYYESGRLHMVAWRQGTTRAWVTNTLTNEIPDRELLAVAHTCR